MPHRPHLVNTILSPYTTRTLFTHQKLALLIKVVFRLALLQHLSPVMVAITGSCPCSTGQRGDPRYGFIHSSTRREHVSLVRTCQYVYVIRAHWHKRYSHVNMSINNFKVYLAAPINKKVYSDLFFFSSVLLKLIPASNT